MYFKALFWMPNLQMLRLRKMVVNSSVLRTISKLQGLQSLSLGEFLFDHESTIVFPSTLLAITSLDLTSSSVIEIVVEHLLDFMTVRTLTIEGPTQGLSILSFTKALSTLIIRTMETNQKLWDAIGRLEALEVLEIWWLLCTKPYDSLALPSTSLPKLRRLLGSPSLSRVVIGRPISSLDLASGIHIWRCTPMDPPVSEHFFNIAQSSTEVTSLSIPLELYVVRSLQEHFPSVEALEIKACHVSFPPVEGYDEVDFDKYERGRLEHIYDEVVTKWPPAPSVMSLKISMNEHYEEQHFLDLVLQRDYIPKISTME
ncbi:hypothetical protein H0H92_012800 [Tricholoma furcatifolium]|nr:hypothetical protein H0H92_012800 [Tricholoma furcatifolium]